MAMKGPKAPGEFRVTDFGKTQVTLTWKQFEKRESIIYTVSGAKFIVVFSVGKLKNRSYLHNL